MVVFGGIIKTAISKTCRTTNTLRSILELKIQNDEGELKSLKFEGNSPVQVGDTIKVHLSEENDLFKKNEILCIEKYQDGKLVRTDYSVNYKP